MTDLMFVIVVVLVAVGFYCLGRLHLLPKVNDAYKRGYNEGRFIADRVTIQNLEVAECGCVMVRMRGGKTAYHTYCKSISQMRKG